MEDIFDRDRYTAPIELEHFSAMGSMRHGTVEESVEAMLDEVNAFLEDHNVVDVEPSASIEGGGRAMADVWIAYTDEQADSVLEDPKLYWEQTRTDFTAYSESQHEEEEQAFVARIKEFAADHEVYDTTFTTDLTTRHDTSYQDAWILYRDPGMDD